MREWERVPATVMRGGTSKGVFLLDSDLPRDAAARDRVILAIFGSPDPRQINGLGGADPLTSKVAIIARSSRADADVDYTVGYVSVDSPVVDYEGNCGNISQAVGPFAVDAGLVRVCEPTTRVRIFNTNTRKHIVADVPVRHGKAAVDGDFVLDGVPGTGARIVLDFVDAAGSKTGALLPTGHATDEMALDDGRCLRVSLVDAAVPVAFVRASDLGFTGRELPDAVRTQPAILAVMEEIRCRAAVMMGLAPAPAAVGPAMPKVALVAPPQAYATIAGRIVAASDCDLLARTKALTVMHKAYAVTGGICASAGALIDGTVVHDVASERARATGIVRLGHPSGVSEYVVAVERTPSGEVTLTKSAVVGTARRILEGFVYVPAGVYWS